MAVKQNNIIDIDLSVTKRKQFRIDGDDNRILELNTSDMSILSRINSSYKDIDTLAKKAMSISTDDNGESESVKTEEFAKTLEEIDSEMRKLVDYIFDSNVSEVCAPEGTMYDMFNGEFRFEHIIDTLIKLYENNLDKEYKLMTKNVKKHTDKYTRK